MNIIPGYRKHRVDKPFYLFIRDSEQRFYITVRPRSDGSIYIRAGTHFKGKSKWHFLYSKVEWENLEEDSSLLFSQSGTNSTGKEEDSEEEEEEEPIFDTEEPGSVKPQLKKDDDDDDEPPERFNQHSIFV